MRQIHGLNVDEFTEHYLIAALWASTDDNGEPLDTDRDLDDFAPEAIKQAIEDCEAFQRDNAELLNQVPQLRGEWSATAQNGHDFWLTRNGHGAGFWDRGYGSLGRELTDAAHVWGSVDLYVGAGGLVYS